MSDTLGQQNKPGDDQTLNPLENKEDIDYEEGSS